MENDKLKGLALPPLGSDAEITVYKAPDGGQYTFPLEDWQLKAIQQTLGLYYESDGNIVMLQREVVEKRLKKMGELRISMDVEK